LRRYETTFIVNPQADDATIDRQVTAIVDIIKADGGEIHRENRIGTRRLAFPIAGLTQGFYTSIIFDAEVSVLPKLDKYYKLEEPYIRFLTIRYDGPLTEDVSLPYESPYERGGSSSYGERHHRPYGFRGDRRHDHSSDSVRSRPALPPEVKDTPASPGDPAGDEGAPKDEQ
jgi:small subunit ribosomal protein S6